MGSYVPVGTVSVVEEEAENMVAGQDINFDLIHALKEKEGGQQGKEDGEEERKQDQEQRPQSLSAGASSWKLKRKKKSKEAGECGGSKEDLKSAKLLVWSDIDWARKAWN